MKHTNLPNYKCDILGFLFLCLGYLVPTIGISIVSIMLGIALGNIWLMVFTTLISWLGAIFSFDFFVCRRQTGQPLRFNLSIIPIKDLIIILLMTIGIILIANISSTIIPTEGKIFGELYQYYMEMLLIMSKELPAFIILALLVAPICEEIIFRGIIMKGLINSGISPKISIWVSAILFGLVHLNPWQFLGGALLGYLFGQVYYKTKSLLIPILLHFFNNLLSVLSMEFLSENFYNEISIYQKIIVFIIGLILFSSFYYLFISRYSHKQDS